MATAQDVLRVAEGEVGYSRWDDALPGTKYGRWYANLVDDGYFGESGVPYCAMFTSWAFNEADASCVGLPGAYCPDMLEAAERAGATVDPRDARPGDVVYFDWGGDGEVDHVGIVVRNCESYIETIEGNTSVGSGSQTNGGVVARRVRSWDYVRGVVRPAYGTDGQDGASPALDVDGSIGTITVTRWQEAMGTDPDGTVTGQRAEDAPLWPALVAVGDYDGSGSQLIRAVQAKVGVPHPTGVWARGSICLLQGWLVMRGYDIGHDEAGVLDMGTAKAVQESLNNDEWGKR